MALKGIKVLEIAGLAPVPFCGMILADFGASVVRIDKTNASDLDSLGSGKQSIALNLKHPKAVQIVKKLSNSFDVLIEPFRPGVMEKLGLGPEVLMKENPKLVYARLSGFGQSGYYSKHGGHDINYLAVSGLLSLFGRYEEKPSFPVNLAADFGGGGLICALGIVLALFEQTKSGLGQIVDCNITSGTAYLGSFLFRSQNLPFVWGNERGKNLLDGGQAFYEVYKTKDGKYMSCGSLEPQFYSNLLIGLGINEEDAPQFSEPEKVFALFTQKFAEKTRDEWCQIFDKLDACVMPVLEISEAPKHQQNIDQQVFSKYENIYAPNPHPKLSRTPGESTALKRNIAVGENTKNILLENGFCEEEILNLEKEGVIFCLKNSKL